MTDPWRERAGSPFETHKSDAVGSKGMVTSNHPIASTAGAEMLALGGNAVDAAIATAFALTVVEPPMVGIFGSGHVILYTGSAESLHVDNYGVAPAAATPDMYDPVSDTWPDYLETSGQQNRVGYRAVAVPGNLKGWCLLEDRYGRLGLDRVIQPAIRYAASGFPASSYLIGIIAECRDDLARFEASREIFLPGGGPPRPGDQIVRSDYARTLERIAGTGAEVLYDGELGETVVADMEANGGIVTMDDLRSYDVIERSPVRGTYRGYEIVAVGPTSSGGTHIIQILNLLESFDVLGMGFGTADSVHLLAECLKIAFADRDVHMGDPAYMDVPLEGLMSKEYAALRRGEIDMERAGSPGAGRPNTHEGESADTTHFTVADDEGNLVCMTQTIHSAFGSRVTVPGTGIMLNNNMYIFDPHPGHANSVAPGKRMLSSMSPTIVLKDGRPFIALGTPGGTRIFGAVLQAIVNVIDHGMTLQEAVEAPRAWTQGQELEVEGGVAPAVRKELAGRGHTVVVVPSVAGGMNGVMYDHGAGVIRGAACWRADGSPVGLSGGPARTGDRATMYRI